VAQKIIEVWTGVEPVQHRAR